MRTCNHSLDDELEDADWAKLICLYFPLKYVMMNAVPQLSKCLILSLLKMGLELLLLNTMATISFDLHHFNELIRKFYAPVEHHTQRPRVQSCDSDCVLSRIKYMGSPLEETIIRYLVDLLSGMSCSLCECCSHNCVYLLNGLTRTIRKVAELFEVTPVAIANCDCCQNWLQIRINYS